MLEDTATEGGLDQTWQLGLPPTASLHNCLSWRPGSTWLALQCDAAMLVVLDIGKHNDEKPSEVQRLAWSKGGDLMAVAWTDDGRFLVIAHVGALGALSVFQVSGRRLTQVLHCPVFFWPKDLCVSMSRDDTSQLVIAVGGSPGVVLYKACVDEGSGCWKLRQVGRLCHLWPVCAVRYGPGGRYLAAAGLGGQLCIWDITDARLELQVQVPAERVTSMAFSACGHALAVACWGGAVFLYLQQDGAFHPPALSANSTAPSESGVEVNEAAQGGGRAGGFAAAAHREDRFAQGAPAAYECKPVGTAPGTASAHGATAAQHTSSGSPCAAAHGGGRAEGLAAAALGEDIVAQGAPAACDSQLAAIEHGEQDTRSVSPPSAAQGGGRAGGLDAAAHTEDTVAQRPPAAAQGGGLAGGLAAAAGGEHTFAQGPPSYESRLAAIDHGIEGAGGWRVGAACLPGQPIKADLTGPTLLEWASHDTLLVTLPSGALTVLRVDGASVVRESMGSSRSASERPSVTGPAMATQNDGPRRDPERLGQDLPAGLRVLPIGNADGWKQIPAGAGTSHAGMARVVEGDANCVKGLAVMHLAGHPLVVSYDRARSLRIAPVINV